MHFLWHFLSMLGDSRLLLPATAILIVVGWHQRQPWALRWAIGLSSVAVLVLTSKLAFLGWGIGSAHLDFTGFSGHAAMSAAVWPIVLGIVLPSCYRWWGVWAGLALALAIAYSRLPLNAHSWSEVLSGSLLGALCSAWTRQNVSTAAPLQPAWLGLALALGICTPLAFPQLHTHDMVLRLATTLAGTPKACDRMCLIANTVTLQPE